ncbi:pyridoxal phosphate-dependent aminotransferase [Sciscionella marina]|uniref:pyridoxal phosphate-dependent aminotransferase n=1 Tax=Sciscionella marina TaxID=508770 RepID=UPI00036A16CF|nr:histidinol-phosphate transaminase [Sciscionella marina]
MAANESALGASPAVLDALAVAAGAVHRYPDPLADELRDELAWHHGVPPEAILVGNGSDELIYLLSWAYAAHGGTVVCADPPYRMDEICGLAAGAEVTRVPLRDWAHDLDAMAGVPAELAHVCNPHNPTGTTHSRADIERFAATAKAGLVVVDEAYIDFADDPVAMTAIPLVAEGSVVVLRTFSKAYGLAGMRVGYLVGPPDLVATLRRIRAPFSVGALAQAAGLAGLRDQEHLRHAREFTRSNRARLTALLTDAGYTVVPSQANFALAVTPDEDALVARLRAHGIAVRPGTGLGLPGTVRISVPSRAGLEMLERALTTDTPVRSSAWNSETKE